MMLTKPKLLIYLTFLIVLLVFWLASAQEVEVEPYPAEPPVQLLENEYGWDIGINSGHIWSGYSNSYDGMYYLSINDTLFEDATPLDWEAFEREYVISRQLWIGDYLLNVTRKIFVPEWGDWARFLELIQNNNGTDLLLRIRIAGNLGSDEETIIWNTSDGDALPESTDSWIGTAHSNYFRRPFLAHVIGTMSIVEATNYCPFIDDFCYEYELILPEQGSIAILHFAIQQANDWYAWESAEAIVVGIPKFNKLYLYDLTPEEMDATQNWDLGYPFVDTTIVTMRSYGSTISTTTKPLGTPVVVDQNQTTTSLTSCTLQLGDVCSINQAYGNFSLEGRLFCFAVCNSTTAAIDTIVVDRDGDNVLNDSIGYDEARGLYDIVEVGNHSYYVIGIDLAFATIESITWYQNDYTTDSYLVIDGKRYNVTVSDPETDGFFTTINVDLNGDGDFSDWQAEVSGSLVTNLINYTLSLEDALGASLWGRVQVTPTQAPDSVNGIWHVGSITLFDNQEYWFILANTSVEYNLTGVDANRDGLFELALGEEGLFQLPGGEVYRVKAIDSLGNELFLDGPSLLSHTGLRVWNPGVGEAVTFLLYLENTANLPLSFNFSDIAMDVDWDVFGIPFEIADELVVGDSIGVTNYLLRLSDVSPDGNFTFDVRKDGTPILTFYTNTSTVVTADDGKLTIEVMELFFDPEMEEHWAFVWLYTYWVELKAGQAIMFPIDILAPPSETVGSVGNFNLSAFEEGMSSIGWRVLRVEVMDTIPPIFELSNLMDHSLYLNETIRFPPFLLDGENYTEQIVAWDNYNLSQGLVDAYGPSLVSVEYSPVIEWSAEPTDTNIYIASPKLPFLPYESYAYRSSWEYEAKLSNFMLVGERSEYTIAFRASDTSSNEIGYNATLYVVPGLPVEASAKWINGTPLNWTNLWFTNLTNVTPFYYAKEPPKEMVYSMGVVINGTKGFEVPAYQPQHACMLIGSMEPILPFITCMWFVNSTDIGLVFDYSYDATKLSTEAVKIHRAYYVQNSTPIDYGYVGVWFAEVGDVKNKSLLKLYRCDEWDQAAKACKAEWRPLKQVYVVYDALIGNVTSYSAFGLGEERFCGDGYCSALEDCETCSEDCGVCPVEYVPIAPPPKVKIHAVAARANITIRAIAAGETVNISIERVEELPIRGLEISVINDVADVRIYIQKLPARPPEIEVEVEGVVYHYLDIGKENIRDEDINLSIIRFEVAKAWVEEQNAGAEDIVLMRWEEGWEKLPTRLVGEDDEYFYYEAKTKELSVFAITVVIPIAVAPPPECPVCPEPGPWSPCIEGKQTRIAWKCGPETNYECQSYEEVRDCVVPAVFPMEWILVLSMAIVLIALILVIRKLR
jgi:PGF-pre-PGF domain-containing protein